MIIYGVWIQGKLLNQPKQLQIQIQIKIESNQIFENKR